jgi:hypothetical protein
MIYEDGNSTSNNNPLSIRLPACLSLIFRTRLLLLFLVSVPVNICLTGAIENWVGVRFAKIAPTPFNKGFYFRTDRSE